MRGPSASASPSPEEGRELVPWLVAILTNKARRASGKLEVVPGREPRQDVTIPLARER
jgi:hypothetical protein